ncbi:hypothetical protein ACL02U_13220 [Streptomyces sp. MS06]|uniref:hypothetical protein n=1 Tax=Streptomyces sp. MS06 TaxID=3385974 RepID=UPI0039A1E30B
MRSRVDRVRALLGRRGAFLLIIGVGKVCWGVGYIAAPSNRGVRPLTAMAPLSTWAWLWIGAGLTVAASAFLKVGRDGPGFVVALIPPTVWAAAYAYAALRGQYDRGLWVAVWYLTSHIGVILWASAVPEHSVPHVLRSARRGKT